MTTIMAIIPQRRKQQQCPWILAQQQNIPALEQDVLATEQSGICDLNREAQGV